MQTAKSPQIGGFSFAPADGGGGHPATIEQYA